MTCFDAFKNINIANTQGQLRIGPCCVAPTKFTDTIDFHNNQYLAELRDKWNNNIWPKECSRCKQAEDQGLVSKRMGSEQWYTDQGLNNNTVELIRLDYWVGNMCNLACAICSPASSSTWCQELKLPIVSKKANINKFWQDLDLSSLKLIHFHGGEPLMSKEHVKMLQAVPFKDQVQVTYNTNATIRVTDELKDLWSQFQLVHLDFSIDDIGDRFEYQRYPANWEDVVSNLNWYLETAPHNVMFGINTTVSWLNQHSLPDLENWLKQNFSTSRFADPVEHRKQFAHGPLSCSSDLASVKRYLDLIDQRRGTDWRKTFPELV